MGDIAKIVGERIKNRRLRLGWTQEELAEKAALHNTYIGQLERGEKNATLESIEKVATGLGVTFEELFEKIIPGENSATSIAAQCYELVDALSPESQRLVLEILQKIMNLKDE